MINKSLPHDHGHLSEHLQTKMPKAKTFDMVSDMLKLMSDSKRIRIFLVFMSLRGMCYQHISAS